MIERWKQNGKPVIVKSPEEWAAEAAGGGVVCPSCGGVLLAYKTITLATRILRYEACHNPNCDRKFVTRQPPREIVREIKSRELSSSGMVAANEDT